MHSQLMFTECIARARLGCLAFPVDEALGEEGQVSKERKAKPNPVHMFCAIENDSAVFNVLPSSGHAAGTAECRSASSSEAPRRL